MSKKDELREQRKGTVINKTSKRQEKVLDKAIINVCKRLVKKFGPINLHHEQRWYLKDVVKRLRQDFPEEEFHYFHEKSFMMPDGGILNICDDLGVRYPILIAEKKNQGTNDLRLAEGKKKQAQGNAIERLGKNVIGFRTALLKESIFPFVCFGDGCDFDESLTIVDRVVTIAMFGELNKESLHNSSGDLFNRGSFYFRVREWTEKEMEDVCYSIAEKAVYYYFSKYDEKSFISI